MTFAYLLDADREITTCCLLCFDSIHSCFLVVLLKTYIFPLCTMDWTHWYGEQFVGCSKLVLDSDFFLFFVVSSTKD